jgi:hypothetical protein
VAGLYDELAGLLSKLEKSANGGEYNLDKSRLLNWYSGKKLYCYCLRIEC